MVIVTILKVLGAAVLLSLAWAGLSAAPYLPTRKKQRGFLLKHLSLEGTEEVVDLGCGDGSLLFELEEKYPSLRLIGVEISLLPFFIAFGRKVWKRSRVQLRLKNLFRQDLSSADIVFVYLLERAYPRLQKKFAKELSDHAVVIVEAWPFPNVTPRRRLQEPDLLAFMFYAGSSFREAKIPHQIS